MTMEPNDDDTNLTPTVEKEKNASNEGLSVGPKQGLTLISKKQMKRLERNKKWMEGKAERRRKEKEKRKLKLASIRASGQFLPTKKVLVPMNESKCRISLVIDCDFESFMNESEVKKLTKQVGRCYAVNKRSSSPAQFFVTSLKGGIREAFMKSQPGFIHWDANCMEDHWKQHFRDKSKIIYLSSESECILPDGKQLNEAEMVIIIGGLVDHNRHKGLCHRLAVSEGLAHARLPIDEHIKMSGRRVLAVNHVFEIMLQACNDVSWTQAFHNIIPQRKLDKT